MSSKKSKARKTTKVSGVSRNKPRLWSRWSETERAKLRSMIVAGASNIELQAALKRPFPSITRYATVIRKELKSGKKATKAARRKS